MAKQRNFPRRAPARPQPSITEISTKAEALEAAGDIPGAIKTYRDWIRHASSPPAPLAWVAQFNLGVLLKASGSLSEAMEAYAAALKQKPGFVQARINLGLIHELQGRQEEAIGEWQTALKLLDEASSQDPALLCITLNNLGRRLEAMQRYPEASAMLTRSLALRPDNEDVLYHWIYLRQRQCEWPIYAPLPGITTEAMITATSALAMLAISDDPAMQLRAARHHVAGKWTATVPRISPATGYAHDKIRIGYLSSNFGMHPVTFLTAELYELHDRSRFEVYGFCWSPEDNSDMRERVRRAMDHFIRIDQMTDEAAAQAIRNNEIDILIDLQGLTAGARPKILSYRPAPVQITYLGFPGTTGLPEIDYVLADRYIIPEESACYYSEEPLYLPDCFQSNDRKRVVSQTLSREEYGLPEDAFVFCTFNKNTKFNPDFFSAWMRILKRTPHSILWLLADNARTQANLLKYAAEQGIGSDRLIFAPRVPLPDYLARYAAADLFLDLSPFNGGTTTTDALWVGLPVLTCAGRSFASRMAGSFLNVIGLPELITTNLAEYENLAVELAHDPVRMRSIKSRLIEGKTTSPLFDTPRFVKNLEDILCRVSVRGYLPSCQGRLFNMNTRKKNRLVVYTVLVGQKEALNDPLRIIGHQAETDLQIDYICFTDNAALTSPTWQMSKLEHPLMPPERLSRLPKTQPHLYFPNYEHSLYIDNTVAFKRLPCRNDLRATLFRAFRHPWRNHPIDEADIIVKSGLDTATPVADQLRFYERIRAFEGVDTLTTGTALLRKHGHPNVKRFGELWWEQILLFSKRDQISLDVCSKAANCPIDHFDGDKRNNDFIFWPALANEKRVLGSFDEDRYAWEHRNDPEAAAHPRQHYLSHAPEGNSYARHTNWFEYLCNRLGSGLGTITPPRRSIAEMINPLLSSPENRIDRILLIGVKSPELYAADAEELVQAQNAFKAYFRFSTQPQIVLVEIDEESIRGEAPFRGAGGLDSFDLVIVIGLSTRLHEQAIAKFDLLLAPSGKLLIQFGLSLTLSEIEAMQTKSHLPGGLDVFHGTHISNPMPIASSLVLYSKGHVDQTSPIANLQSLPKQQYQ